MTHPNARRVSLDGKVAIITGASRGIGRAIAERLASEGAKLELVARDRARLDALVRELPDAVAHVADVASEDDVERVVRDVLERRGRVDVLINNAGIGVFGPIEKTSWDDFVKVLHVNAGGTFLLSRAVVDPMRRQGAGDILNIASVVGSKGYREQAVYGASKHAVIGLTKALAVELHGTGVRVRAISPGGVATDLIREARPDLSLDGLIRPEDIADIVAFLLTAPATAVIDNVNVRRAGNEPWF